MELVELKSELTILCPNSKHTIENKLVLKGGGKAFNIIQTEKSDYIIEGSKRKGEVKLVKEMMNQIPKLLNARTIPNLVLNCTFCECMTRAVGAIDIVQCSIWVFSEG